MNRWGNVDVYTICLTYTIVCLPHDDHVISRSRSVWQILLSVSVQASNSIGIAIVMSCITKNGLESKQAYKSYSLKWSGESNGNEIQREKWIFAIGNHFWCCKTVNGQYLTTAFWLLHFKCISASHILFIKVSFVRTPACHGGGPMHESADCYFLFHLFLYNIHFLLHTYCTSDFKIFSWIPASSAVLKQKSV